MTVPRRGREALLAIAGALLLSALLLRPLPWRPQAMPRYVGATASMDNADRDLNAWILAWTARAAASGGAGLFDGQLPSGFEVPMPSDDPTLREDEDPLEPGDLDLGLAPRVSEGEGE